MANEVAVKAASAVPALRPTPAALDITSEDVALPRIYIGQYMSQAVKDGLVKAGSIFAATGPDDPDPNVLSTATKEGATDPVRIHIVGLHKGKSYSEQGGELELYSYNDPKAPEGAWTTYNYSVVLPTVDTEMPFKWLLTRTGQNTAKQINTVLKKNEARGPAWINAFDLTTQKRENAKGEFFVARVAVVEPDPEHIKIAEELGYAIAGQSASYGATGDEPSI